MKKLFFFLVLVMAIFNSKAQIINFPDANFKANLLQSSSSNSIAKNSLGVNVAIDMNGDNEIQLSEALVIHQLNFHYTTVTNISGIENFQNLRKLDCSGISITSLDVTSLINLTDLSFCNGMLISLNANGLTNLVNLKCWNNQLISLNVSGNINLVSLSCMNNQLTNLNLAGLSQLEDLSCYSNQLNTLNLSGCSSLKNLYTYNNLISSLSVVDSPLLFSLECYNNNITSLNLSQNSLINWVKCSNNLISNLNITGCRQLSSLRADFNLLTTLDANDTNLSELYVNNNQLTSLFVKNGKFETPFYYFNNPNLSYICCDENQLATLQSGIVTYGIPNCTVNSYCSFTPGGSFKTIAGNSKFDFDLNGCDYNDINYSFMKFNIVNGSVVSNLFANLTGMYTIALPLGIYTISPVVENPTYFIISPPSASITFNTNSNDITQNFCIAPNGLHQDLEVLLVPLSAARPGFNARYRLIYKNKGNQTVSGYVYLNYNANANVMTLVSSNPSVSNATNGELTWNYINLQPLETRTIEFSMLLNTPTQNPPLNAGDELGLEAIIYPIDNDEYYPDNHSQIKQFVVNSFDPNDKTCIEGLTVTPSMVGQYVHYVIRFENTGTFPAENIVVTDLIDSAKFDINTLIPMSGSHLFETRIKNGKVEFIFENINLPFDDANNDGYVAFKIKTKPTLVVGNTFSNTANIYFDYNFPITTNTATTTVAALSNQDFDFGSYFSVYPNPAKDILQFDTKTEIGVKSISIYNTLGQVVLVITNPESNATIDVGSLKAGTYFLKVNSDRGTANTKFIKE